MTSKILRFFIILSIIISIIIIIVQAILLGFGINFGCAMRYDDTKDAVLTKSVTLNANGKYDESACQYDNTCSDANKRYGKWLKVDLDIYKDYDITFEIDGEVSLCNATYNYNGKELEIPRVDGKHDGGLPIILDASKGKFHQITNIFPNDKIQIGIGKNSIRSDEPIPQLDSLKTSPQADCINGITGDKKSFHPVCNRMSPYVGVPAVLEIKKTTDSPLWKCRKQELENITHDNIASACENQKLPDCDKEFHFCCPLLSNPYTDGVSMFYHNLDILFHNTVFPMPYSEQLIYEPEQYVNSNRDLMSPLPYLGEQIRSATIKTLNDLPEKAKMSEASWFAFEATDDLSNIQPKQSGLERVIHNIQSDKSARFLPDDKTTTDQFAIIVDPSTTNTSSTIPKKLEDRIILDWQVTNLPEGDINQNYLEARFLFSYENPNMLKYCTGGYVFYLKHTKCYRQNGQYFSTPYKDEQGKVQYIDKGKIKYLLLDYDQDPNQNPTLANSANALLFNKQQSSIKADFNGVIWLLIENNREDYKNSAGVYNINITQRHSSAHVADNYDRWTPIKKLFTDKWQEINKNIFQHLTCYGENKASCINFFKVIRALLVLYIMLFGLQFSLGITKINHLDFVSRMFKVIFVAGLMNEQTFDFFNTYIFDLVYNFSDEIMGAIYSKQISSTPGIDNNLAMFFEEVYGVFASPIFYLQLVAQIGTGLSGIITFLIIFLSLIMFLIPVLEFICIYLLSSLGVSILLALAPIFLIFVLFQSTRHLFDNWIRFLARYIFEPSMFFIGLSILTKLFLIYVDQVLGYSVCSKCSIVFKIPFVETMFPTLRGLESVPIFCLYWFAPWGYDAISTPFASSLPHIVALAVISFCTFKYAHLSSQICEKIFGLVSNPGSTSKVGSGLEKDLIKKIKG
jgi:type IV secretion system protein VirB6